jgi:hypothetical protein
MLWRNSRGRPLNAPAAFIHPCQPIVAKQPPRGPGWVHGLKHDGYRLRVRSMTEGVRNAVLTNIVVVSLALLLSCFTNDRETKILLGIPDTAVEQTPDTDTDRNNFACRQYGFYPGTKQFDDCMKYVGSKRSIFPSPSPR